MTRIREEEEDCYLYRYIVCELVAVSSEEPCIVNVSDSDIVICVGTLYVSWWQCQVKSRAL